MSAFDYVLPLMVRRFGCPISIPWLYLFTQPEIFRFSEGKDSPDGRIIDVRLNKDCLVNDNNELAGRADLLLVRMCGVTPPRSLLSPMLDSIFKAIQTSPVGFNERIVDMSHPEFDHSRGELD